jgi:hypothetical protein
MEHRATISRFFAEGVRNAYPVVREHGGRVPQPNADVGYPDILG